MDKQVYVLEVCNTIVSALDRDCEANKKAKWTFMGAFRTSEDARNYRDHNDIRTSLTIRPLDLLDNVNTYFEQYKHCPECDGYPRDNQTAYLVQKKHTRSGCDEWHFNCILSTHDDALRFTNRYKYDVAQYRIIPLRFPFCKDDFEYEFSLIRHNERVRREKEEKENVEKETKLKNLDGIAKRSNTLFNILLAVSLLNIIATIWF